MKEPILLVSQKIFLKKIRVEKMNKTATITWVTYYNYGTILQAYALQCYLNNKGYDNTILNDEFVIPKPSKRKKILHAIASFLIKERNVFDKVKLKSDDMFDCFKQQYLHIDYDVVNLSDTGQKYDTFICGSDQIWSPFSLDNLNAGFYYASFTKRKKIAYAPSIGVSKVPQKYRAKLKKFTNEFEFLSAREQQSVDILHELTGKDVIRVVDPTLLLDITQWNILIPQVRPCKEKYILAYFLSPNPVYINTAFEYAKRMGVKMKMFFTDKSYIDYDCDLITAGPKEFLHYVRDAECLFTDSYHGSIFASIFHTQFFTFKRFKQNVRSQNSRVENLFNMMGIGERLLDEDKCKKVYTLSNIDFVYVNSNLKTFIIQSKEYLEKALR